MKLRNITVLMILCAILLCAAVSCTGNDQQPDPAETPTHAEATDEATDIGTEGSTEEQPSQPSVTYPEDGPIWSKDY